MIGLQADGAMQNRKNGGVGERCVALVVDRLLDFVRLKIRPAERVRLVHTADRLVDRPDLIVWISVVSCVKSLSSTKTHQLLAVRRAEEDVDASFRAR